MRIALIADHVGLPQRQAEGGSDAEADAYPHDEDARVTALARALAGLQHQVTIYARMDAAGLPGSTARCPGVTLEYLDAGPQERLTDDRLLPHVAAFAGQLAQRWQGSAPEIVHAQSWTSGMAALAAARDLGLPVVQSFRSVVSDPVEIGQSDGRRPARASAAKVRLQGAAGRSAAAVLARTPAEVIDLSRLGVPRASVKVVPAGVDDTQFSPSGPAAKRGGPPRLLTVTPLAERRDLSNILQALAHVPEAELVIVGGPHRDRLPDDRGYRAATRAARQLGLAGRLTFTGAVSRADMPGLMRSADMLVSMTAAAPFGAVALDAMACGIPVIAVAAGLAAEAVIDGITGFLVPPGQPMLLARRIGQLLASPMLREGYGLAAASRAQNRYAWKRIAAETLAVYESLFRGPADNAA
jgi:glycosyltransferase involved in cell wall biosynthesis